MAKVVEPLEGHAAGHRSIADYRHHTTPVAGSGPCGGKPVGVREDGRGVGVLDPVVGRLVPGGVARQEAGLAESSKVGGSAGQQLVDVGLVSGVKEDGVPRAVKDSMKGQRELNGAQIRAEVAAGAVHGVDDALA